MLIRSRRPTANPPRSLEIAASKAFSCARVEVTRSAPKRWKAELQGVCAADEALAVAQHRRVAATSRNDRTRQSPAGQVLQKRLPMPTLAAGERGPSAPPAALDDVWPSPAATASARLRAVPLKAWTSARRRGTARTSLTPPPPSRPPKMYAVGHCATQSPAPPASDGGRVTPSTVPLRVAPLAGDLARLQSRAAAHRNRHVQGASRLARRSGARRRRRRDRGSRCAAMRHGRADVTRTGVTQRPADVGALLRGRCVIAYGGGSRRGSGGTKDERGVAYQAARAAVSRLGRQREVRRHRRSAAALPACSTRVVGAGHRDASRRARDPRHDGSAMSPTDLLNDAEMGEEDSDDDDDFDEAAAAIAALRERRRRRRRRGGGGRRRKRPPSARLHAAAARTRRGARPRARRGRRDARASRGKLRATKNQRVPSRSTSTRPTTARTQRLLVALEVSVAAPRGSSVLSRSRDPWHEQLALDDTQLVLTGETAAERERHEDVFPI